MKSSASEPGLRPSSDAELLYTKRNSAVKSFGITAEFVFLLYTERNSAVKSFGITAESVSVYNNRTS